MTEQTEAVRPQRLALPQAEDAVIWCHVTGKVERYVANRYKGRWLVAGLTAPDQDRYIVSRGFPDSAIREVLAILDPGRAPAAPARKVDPKDAPVEVFDVEPGDLLHVTLPIIDVDGEEAYVVLPASWEHQDGRNWTVLYRTDEFLPIPGVTVTRPAAPPLPSEPGNPGTATVRGVPGVTVMLSPSDDGDRQPWRSAVPVAGQMWHCPADITDYVPLAGVDTEATR
jgi:hypothetical protein